MDDSLDSISSIEGAQLEGAAAELKQWTKEETERNETVLDDLEVLKANMESIVDTTVPTKKNKGAGTEWSLPNIHNKIRKIEGRVSDFPGICCTKSDVKDALKDALKEVAKPKHNPKISCSSDVTTKKLKDTLSEFEAKVNTQIHTHTRK